MGVAVAGVVGRLVGASGLVQAAEALDVGAHIAGGELCKCLKMVVTLLIGVLEA